MGVITGLSTAVGRLALLIKSECKPGGLSADRATLETSLPELLGKVVEDLDVVGNIRSIVLWNDGDAS